MAIHRKITKAKARGDSKLDQLPEDRRVELREGLLAGWTYAKAQDWLWIECGVRASLSSFTPFYRRHVEPVLREQKEFAALSARTIEKLAKESDAFDAAAISELKAYAFELMRRPDGDPEEKRKWLETLIKAQAGARDDRKIALLEKKAAQADEAQRVTGDHKLTPAEKQERMKQIFGMG